MTSPLDGYRPMSGYGSAAQTTRRKSRCSSRGFAVGLLFAVSARLQFKNQRAGYVLLLFLALFDFVSEFVAQGTLRSAGLPPTRARSDHFGCGFDRGLLVGGHQSGIELGPVDRSDEIARRDRAADDNSGVDPRSVHERSKHRFAQEVL